MTCFISRSVNVEILVCFSIDRFRMDETEEEEVISLKVKTNEYNFCVKTGNLLKRVRSLFRLTKLEKNEIIEGSVETHIVIER